MGTDYDHETTFRRNPSDTKAFEALRRRLAEQDDCASAARLYERHATAIDDAQESTHLLWEAAELYAEVGDSTGHRRVLYRLLALDSDARALKKLQDEAEHTRHYAGLLKLLLAEVDSLGDHKGKRLADLHHRIAQLWAEVFFRLDKAVAHYRSAADVAPDPTHSLASARNIYCTTGQWRHAAKIYRHEIEATEEISVKTRLLTELSVLQSDRLGDLPGAAKTLNDTLRLTPGNEDLCCKLAEIYTAPQWPEPGGLDKAAALFIQIANDHSASGDWDGAISFLRRALGADPESEQAAQKLEQVYQQMERWSDLERLYRQRIEMVDGLQAIELQIRRAELLENTLGDCEAACACYEAVLPHCPPDAPAYRRLQRLYRKTGNLPALRSLLDRMIETAPDEHSQVQLLLQLAQIERDDLAAPRQAAARLHEVLQIEPTNEQALQAYAEYFRTTGDLPRLAELLRFAAEAAMEGKAAPRRACTHLEALAQVCETDLSDLDGALDAWRQLLELHPDTALCRSEIARLESKKASWAELIDGYEAQIAASRSDAEALHARRQMAYALYEGRIEPARLLAVLKEILLMAPHDTQALQITTDVCQQLCDHDGLAETLRLRLPRVMRREERLETLSQLASLYAERLDRPRDAVWAYTELLDIAPDDEQSFAALDRILTKNEDWAELARLLNHRIERAKDVATRVSSFKRLAHLLEDQLDQPQQAIAQWEGVLSSKPDDSEAIEALVNLCKQAERWPALLKLCKRRLHTAGSGDQELQVSLLRQIALIADEHLERPTEAVHAYEALLRLRPADSEALAALARLLAKLGRYPEVVAIIERQIELALDPSEKEDLAFQQVDILEQKLMVPERAILVYRRIIDDYAPESTDAYRALKLLQIGRGQYAEAARIAEQELFLLPTETPTEAVRLELSLEIAELWWDKLNDAERATLAYERVLELATDNRSALEALRVLYPKTGLYAQLVDRVPQLIDSVEGVRDRRMLLFELAEVCEKHLGDHEQAFEYYHRAWELSGTEGQALTDLHRIAQQHGMWDELLRVYQQAFNLSEIPAQRVAFARQMAEIARGDLGSPAQAFSMLERALDTSPEDESIVTDLEQLAESEPSLYPQLLRRYEDLAEASAVPTRRRSLRRRAAALAETRAGAPDRALRNLVALYRDHLAIPADAGVDPLTDHAQVVAEIQRLAKITADWSPALYIYLERLQWARTTAAQVEILGELASMFEREMGLVARAFVAYLYAFMLRPADPQIVEQLWRLASAFQASPDASRDDVGKMPLFYPEEISRAIRSLPGTIEEISSNDLELFENTPPPTLMSASEEPVTPPPMPIESAAALRDPTLQLSTDDLIETGNPGLRDEAALSTRQSVAGPTPSQTLALVQPPMVDGSMWERLAAAYRQLPGTDDDKIDRLMAEADVLERGAHQPGRALEALAEAAAIDPSRAAPRDALERIAHKHDGMTKLLAVYDDLVERAASVEVLCTLRMRAGELHLRAGAAERARELFAAVLAVDPTHAAASAALTDLYQSQQKWKELASHLERQLETLGPRLDPERRRKRLIELADLYQYTLELPLDATEFLTRAIKDSPQDRTSLYRLADLYESTGLWPKLVETLNELIQLSQDVSERADLRLRVGGVFEHELELADEAIAAYKHVLTESAAEPPSAAAIDVALERLQHLYEKHDQQQELMTVLERRVEAAAARPELQLRLLGQLAASLEKRGQLQQAAAALDRARHIAGDSDDLDDHLARVLVQAGRYEEAAQILEARLQQLSGKAEAEQVAEVLVMLARLQGEHLGEEQRCQQLLHQALEISPNHWQALQQLAASHRRVGATSEYARLVLRLTEQHPDPEVVQKLLLASANGLRDSDPQAAALLFERAHQYAPEDIEVLDALLQVVPDRQRRVELLKHKLELVEDSEARAQAFMQLGRSQIQLGQPLGEVQQTYRRALEQQPDMLEALDAISALMLSQGQITQAEQLLTPALKRIKGTKAHGASGPLHYRLGIVLERLERDDDGYRFLLEAKRLMPQNLLVQLALGENRYRAQRWREALRYLGSAAEHPEAAKHMHEVATALHHAGLCERRLRRGQRSSRYFEKALEFDPEQADALREVAQSALSLGRFEKAATSLQRLAHIVTTAKERVSLLLQAGQLFSEKANMPNRAAACLEQVGLALAHTYPCPVVPNERLRLLTELLPTLAAMGRREAVAVVARTLAQLTSITSERIEYLLQAGTAYRELAQLGAAEACWTEIVSIAPNSGEATLGLAQCLEAGQRDEELVSLLDKHLHGVKRTTDEDDSATRADLFAMLGHARLRLGRTIAAIDALQRMLALREDHATRKQLAQLYKEQPQLRSAALDNYRALARDLTETEALTALARAMTESNPYQAFCIYKVLAALQQLDRAGEHHLTNHQIQEVSLDQPYPGELSEDDRVELFDSTHSPELREILSTLWDAVPILLDKQLSSYGISASQRVSPVADSDLAKAFSQMTRALGVRTTGLYLQRGEHSADLPPIVITGTAPPALLVGQAIARCTTPARLRFLLGRALELGRAPAILAAGLERSEFADLFTAVLRAFHPRHMNHNGLSTDERNNIERLRRRFPYKISRRLGELFREHPNVPFDSAQWRQSVYLMANRVGLVLCGDLDTVIVQVKQEDPSLTDKPTAEAVKSSAAMRDLLAFAASDAFYACRKKLGLAD